ncbi:MAG: hypothetical protein Q4C49_00660 [Bacillota bacterium]|nr:hypothetical protein [Bacillota bacterium]
MHEMHSRSLTVAESLTAGINIISRAETAKFAKRGLYLTAVAQGLNTSISYANPDELIRRTNLLFNAYSQ